MQIEVSPTRAQQPNSASPIWCKRARYRRRGRGVHHRLVRESHGRHQNVPIVRVGNFASYPAEQIQTGFGRMDAFLIEARSIGGLSGSPVFVHIGNVRVVEVQLKSATKPVY
jgi:hypothetical protein